MKWEDDLIKDIKTNDEIFNDRDYPLKDTYSGDEFSKCNQASLLEFFLKIKNNCKSILEIGVCRNKSKSSTYVFLDNKLEETYYFGIDLKDKSFLHKYGKNIFTIQSNSSNIEQNMDYINKQGINTFDFIFIDGWHSINQILIDWEYTKYLNNNGIVALHDINHHPGPKSFIESINQDKWYVDLRCSKDWGIGFLIKKD
jgi:hypothetical protein